MVADFPPHVRASIDHSHSNLLLERLAPEERRLLLADSELVELQSASILGSAGRRLTHAYFPTTSVISLLTPHIEANHLGVGTIGFEGVFGGGSALGIAVSVFDAVVTGVGDAWCIEVGKLAHHGRKSARLTNLISRFLVVELSQVGSVAVCNRFHTLRQRLSRCLLTTQDRLHSTDLYLTHHTLSNILGVRRASISVAASELQSLNLIRYTRGHIVVIDRARLLLSACACYQWERINYEMIMGKPG